MRRVLFVTPCFPPDASPGTHRVLRLVRHLSSAGWSVRVLTLTTGTFRPWGAVDPQLLGRVPSTVIVERRPAYRPLVTLAAIRNRFLRRDARSGGRGVAPQDGQLRTDRGRWQRAKDLVTDLLTIPDDENGWVWRAVPAGVRLARTAGCDLLVSSAPPFTAHLVAAAIQRATGVPWVADFRDPWCRSRWTRAGLQRPWLRRIHERSERLTVSRAAAVILNTEPMREEYARHYGPEVAAKFVAIPNGFDPFPVPVAERSGAHGPLTMVHSGSLYNQRDPRPLLIAMAALVHSGRLRAGDLLLHLVGSVSPEFDVPGHVGRLGLGGLVKLTGRVAHQESLRLLASADVLLLIQPGTDLQVPAKLYEYMAAGKPVLAITGPGAVADIVTRAGLGVVVHPGDDAGLTAALAHLCEHRDRLTSLYPRDEGVLRQFDGRELARRFEAVLDTVIRQRTQ